MLDVATFFVVIVCGAYFVVLGLASLVAPERAKGFLLGFATTAAKHYLELALRMIVGASLVVQAPYLEFSRAVNVFGWLLIVTTAVLLVTPWKWHQRFATRTVPAAMRFIALIGIASILLGILVITILLRRL